MGFYGNTLSETPQSFRHIYTRDKDDQVTATITAHQLEDYLCFDTSDYIKAVGVPAHQVIHFDLVEPMDNEGHPTLKKFSLNLFSLTEGGIKEPLFSGADSDKNTVMTVAKVGLISSLEDIYLPIVSQTRNGLMSFVDKQNLDRLLSVMTGSTYIVYFVDIAANNIQYVQVKSGQRLTSDQVPALPQSNPEEGIVVLGWKDWSSLNVYTGAGDLISDLGEVVSNQVFTVFYQDEEEEEPPEPGQVKISFINQEKDSEKIITQWGTVGEYYSTITIPEWSDENEVWDVQGWVEIGNDEIIDSSSWSTMVIEQSTFFTLKKEPKVQSSLITKIQLGDGDPPQYAGNSADGLTALIPGGSKTKFGVVKVIHELETDPADYDNDENPAPEHDSLDPYEVPCLSLATRLATKDNSGWMSKKEKVSFDYLNPKWDAGNFKMTFCNQAGGPMAGYKNMTNSSINSNANASWMRLGKTVFVTGSISIIKDGSPYNSATYLNNCGLSNFPFAFSNYASGSVYMEPYGADISEFVEKRIKRITRIIGSKDSLFAIFYTTVNDESVPVLFEPRTDEDIEDQDNYLKGWDVTLDFSIVYMTNAEDNQDDEGDEDEKE